MNLLSIKQNASIFQGNLKKKHYFEGWYFKLVNSQQQEVLAIIPGIATTNDSQESHAFIQILDGKTAEYYYITYPLTDFKYSKEKFTVQIGKNIFSDTQLKINIKTPKITLKGHLKFSNLQKLPFKNLFPGVMSYFSYFPSMDCYHGIVSMNHRINGNVLYQNKKITFNHQKGYIEKDWGSSFPKKWIWMQGNHFQDQNRSFMFSIAQIDYFGVKFFGFLGILYDNGNFYRFGTYNFDKCRIISLSDTKVSLTIQNRDFFIGIHASKDKFSTGLMKAPNKGFMTAKCAETINAHIKISFYLKTTHQVTSNKQYRKVFRDETGWAGLEIMGTRDDFQKVLHNQIK